MKNKNKKEKKSIDELSINTIRTLSMDAVQKANSGHPGTPMALAPAIYVLFTKHLKHNPKNPKWFNRDRFVLSNGHASMLLYSILHLTGYGVSLEDLKNFRQWDSITPGHPENDRTPGVETTTGPLGQGFMNGVGMAIAERHLASLFNVKGNKIVDHYTYVFCSDGDLMEGASHEAASIAGHFGLGKLIYLYDDNHISIEGVTELTYSDNVKKRFEGYNWHVQNIGEKANDIKVLSEAIDNAKKEKNKPSMIIVRSHIAYGAPNMHDTAESHGSPLGEEEVKLTKRFYGWPEDKTFYVPDEVTKHMSKIVEKGKKNEEEWNEKYKNYKKENPELAKQFETTLKLELPKNWDEKLPVFQASDKPIATRSAGGKVLNSIAEHLPWLIGGSGDLSPSTKTLLSNSDYYEKGKYENRNFTYGIREHAMCGISNGMYLHGGVRPFAATFFVFTDYARPSIRLASIMELPIIYVMTHDSIGLGEDGPTHQPVEHLASLRAMPHICIIRPADANETAFAWKAAITRTTGPTMLVLSRQNLPIFDRNKYSSAEGVLKGAYILSKEKSGTPDVILISTGSEVHLTLEAQEKLKEKNIDARVVSMPSWELFKEQSEEYKEEVLPSQLKARLAVEAASPFGWSEWVGDSGDVIGIDKFGASAPYKEIYKHYGFTVENIVNKSEKLLSKDNGKVEI
jgi:transketolase